MMIGQTVLTVLVTVSLAACAVSPVVLLALFLRELKKESLW